MNRKTHTSLTVARFFAKFILGDGRLRQQGLLQVVPVPVQLVVLPMTLRVGEFDAAVRAGGVVALRGPVVIQHGRFWRLRKSSRVINKQKHRTVYNSKVL